MKRRAKKLGIRGLYILGLGWSPKKCVYWVCEESKDRIAVTSDDKKKQDVFSVKLLVQVLIFKRVKFCLNNRFLGLNFLNLTRRHGYISHLKNERILSYVC